MFDESYQEGNDFNLKTVQKKYCLKDADGNLLEEGWEDIVNKRFFPTMMKDKEEMAGAIRMLGINDMRDIMLGRKFLTAGGISFGLGNDFVNSSLSNCYVLSIPKDSITGIFQFLADASNTYKKRGGVGSSLEILRPKGAKVNNAALTSSGSVSFLPLISETTQTIGQNNRRGAFMGAMFVHHPDIIDFVNSKAFPEKVFPKDPMSDRNCDISGANLSVKVTNHFMDAVKCDGEIDLYFPDIESEEYENWDGKYHRYKGPFKVYKTIRAKELYDAIIEANWKIGDPGILFWDNIINNSSEMFDEKIEPAGVNPCQPANATLLGRNGIITMGELKEGDEIWSEDGWVTVEKKWSTGVKDVYKYTTNSGFFLGTDNHRIVSDGAKIEVKDADSIDSLAGCRKHVENVDPQLVMDGLVLGDGTVHKASGNLITLCIGENDMDYLDSEVSHLINRYRCGIDSYAYEVSTNISSDELIYTYERFIPDRYMRMPYDDTCAFLRGLYSANGSVINTGRVAYKTASKKMSEQVQLLLSSVGIKSYITTNKAKNVKFSNGVYTCRESYDVNISTYTSIFFNNIGFIQDYKMEKLLPLIKNSTGKVTYDIISKEYIGREEVFDITVSGHHHTYWTGGVNVSNCAEESLADGASCLLASYCLSNFVKNPWTEDAYFDWDDFKSVCNEAVRFMDYCIDKNDHPLDRQNQIAKYARKIGLGITALGDALAMIGIKYGSQESIDFAEKLGYEKLVAEMRSSIAIAKVYGSCKALGTKEKREKYIAQPFFQRLLHRHPELYKLYNEVINVGLRNTAFGSIAPTGTLSVMAGNTTSGIEPLFALEYYRESRLYPGEHTRIVHFPILEYAKENGLQDSLFDMSREEILDKFNYVESHSLDYKERINIVSALQFYTTDAISGTINLPEDVDKESIADIYMYAYDKGLKGITVYREGSKTGVLNTVLREQEEFLDTWSDHKDDIVKMDVKLPPEYPMRGYELNSEGKKWRLHVAFKDKEMTRPFAIFVQTNSRESIVDTMNTLQVLESLAVSEGIPEEHIERNKEKYNAQTNITKIARALGLLLRHNVKICKIIDALNTVECHAGSFIFRIRKFLKQFDKNGKAVCKSCGKSNLKHENGCHICLDCGFSGCD